jgi:Reverse transcriptase (RNA-dependent DNA polymerase)
MAEVIYDILDRKDPPSNAVARAMIPHFSPFQPPEPDDLPLPNFDNDHASLQPDASPPAGPEPETIDTATTPDIPYSWTRIPRVSGMNRLAREWTTSYNPAPLAYTSPTSSAASEDSASTSPSEEAELALEDCCAPHEMAFAAGLPDITVYPQTLRAALNTPHHLYWWKAVCTEFENCENRQVWTILQKSNVPKGRKIIGNRWVFARKDDGRYRARTLAKGFSQIPGQYFQENHAPVINDTKYHLILVLKLLFGLKSKYWDGFSLWYFRRRNLHAISWWLWKVFTNRKREGVSAKDHCFLLLKSLYG